MNASVCVISINVSNMKKALQFYKDVLGFEVDKEYGEKIISLAHKGIPLILEETQEVINKTAELHKGIVIALQTNNIEETVKHLKQHNVQFIVDEPTPCPPGKFISFLDPFGNVLEYLQFQ